MKALPLPLAAWASALLLSIPYLATGQSAQPYTIPRLICTKDTGICSGTQVPIRTTPMHTFRWQPTGYLDDPASPNPIASPPVTTTYFLTAMLPSPVNLVRNGDFSDGNKDFTSEYTYDQTNRMEGEYCVGPNPRDWNKYNFVTCGDHTTGDGNMLIVNGSAYAGTKVWSQQVSVLPGKNYTLSAWIESVSRGNPAILQFSINGIPVGNAVHSTVATCDWQPFNTTWSSGNDTAAFISVTNINTLSSSNDFALDDISFTFQGPVMDSVTILVYPNPTIQVSKAHDIYCSQAVTQLSAAGALSYSWQPSAGLSDTTTSNPTVSIDTTTTYVVTGTDINGCYATGKVTVQVRTAAKETFIVPNAFTPNGDGHNDCYGIQRWGDVQVEEFSIFNRAGVRVFTSRSPSGGWDGNFNGHPQPSGGYVYVIRAKTFCGPVTRTGTVMLVR